MKENNFFENWWKKKLEESNEVPPDNIWKNISNELDIYSVWSNISTELDIRESRKRRRVAFVYFFSIVGLFFVGGWIFFMSEFSLEKRDLATHKISKTPIHTNLTSVANQLTKKSTKQKLRKKNAETLNYNAHVGVNIPVVSAGITLIRQQVPTASFTVPISNTTIPVTNLAIPVTGIALQSMKTDEKLSSDTRHDTDNLILDRNISNEKIVGREYMQSINFTEKYLCFTDTNLLTQQLYPYDTITNLAKSKEIPKAGRFYAGIVFSVQNPWLMNHYTYNSLLESSINEAVPIVGICYGVSSAYNFSNGLNINGDLFIQSRYGQAYNSYNNGTYEKERINLDYKQINLYSVKRKDRQLKSKNLIFSNGPLLGLSLKYLYYASKTINGLKNDATKQYTKYDFGVLIGYEYSLSVKTKWMFCASLNGDFGLNNIFAGNGVEPKGFNQTRNSSLRLGIGIRYKIK